MSHNLKIGSETFNAVEKLTAKNTSGIAVEFIKPTGSKTIESNGTHDVTNVSSAVVNVPVGTEPSGTLNIDSNGTHDVTQYASALVSVPVGTNPSGTIKINANGSYDVVNFANALVNVEGVIDETKVTHFATGVVPNVTAGQQMTVTGIKDMLTGEAFNVQGVLAYYEVTSNTTIYPANHAKEVPAVFCFIRDNRSKFGICMCCAATDTNVKYVREVRLNSDIGGVSKPENTKITFNGNSFTYEADPGMYGLLAASAWRWVAWG